jgi:hypothetical protein
MCRVANVMKLLSVMPPSAKAWLAAVISAGFVAGGPSPAKAQEFSAGLVMMRDSNNIDNKVLAGRIWVREARVRLETPEFTNAFFLVDVAQPSAYFVRPAMRTYMDARQSSLLTRLFVPVDPSGPCRRWQAMAELAGIAGQGDWRCERSGEETIDGRSTVVFRASFGSGRALLGWIDPSRGFPLRIRTEEGAVISLEKIRDEAQPASLFELPPNSKKFSPEALIEQIKQSDVWVSEPKDSADTRR